MKKTPLYFSMFGGYRRFHPMWWKDLGWYIIKGFWRDIYWFYHRGRYGWCPRDVWSLDNYLDKVIGETLLQLADNCHGAPNGYPLGADGPKDMDGFEVTHFDQWEADLRRWSKAFMDVARDDYYEIHGDHYTAWRADEQERRERRNAALKEITPWWEALWD